MFCPARPLEKTPLTGRFSFLYVIFFDMAKPVPSFLRI